jgi:hypothetical protein
MKTKHLVIIVLLIVLALTSCGHHGNSSSLSNSPGSGTTSENSKKIKLPYPDPSGYASTVSVVPNLIQITSGEKNDYLNAQFAKYGYNVAYRTGNYVTLNVPDGDLNKAAYQLRKEPSVLAVDVIHEYNLRTPPEKFPTLKTASFFSIDPMYGDEYRTINWSSINDPSTDVTAIPGQRLDMDMINPEQGWDVLRISGVSSTPVVLAIIDAGVYRQGPADPSPGTPHPDIDPSRISDKSAHVFAGGNVDTTDWGYDINPSSGGPYRHTGNALMGIAAANINYPIGYSRAAAAPYDVWYASIAGVDPAATVMVIKTGTVSGSPTNPVWTFTDQEITNSINYAVANGANVILLGMFSNVGATPVNSALQTAITAARNAGILVVAPAGQDLSVMVDPDGTPNSGDEYWDNGVDVSNISPAKAAGVMSVASTGISQNSYGHTPVAYQFSLPFAEPKNQLAGYSNKNASIAAPGWAVSFGGNYFGNFFGTEYSAAYVAGAACICYQAIINHNGGTPPAGIDTTVFNILQQTAFENIGAITGMPGNTGILDIGLAASVANNGGWNTVIQGLSFQTISTSNLVMAGGYPESLPTVGQPFWASATVVGGSGTYQVEVDWGDGSRTPAIGTIPFVSGDTINKTNPYIQPGKYTLAIVVTDTSAQQQQAILTIPVLATNPLGVGPITLTDGSGNAVTGNPIAGTNYIFHANLTNVLVAPGNSVSYLWDFGDTGTSTLENPVHQWIGGGAKTVTLTVTEALRIPVTHQDTFNVS